MERLKDYQKRLILAGVLAVAAFFWIWFHQYLGTDSYWVALIAFGVYLACGCRAKKLPLMMLGAVGGVLWGVLTYALSMLFFPTFAIISAAVAGAILILVAALISVPRMYDLLPMTIVGWGSFIGAMLRYETLISTKVVWAIPKVVSTMFGVILSLIVGLLLGALLATPLLGTPAVCEE